MANKLVLELIADSNNLLKAMEQSQKSINALAKQAVQAGDALGGSLNRELEKFEGLSKVVSTSAGLISGAFAGAAAIATTAAVGLFAMSKSASSVGDEINKTSQKLGVGAEELSALRYAADLSDISMDTFTTSLKKLATQQQSAATGNKESLATFRELGVNFRFVDGSLRPLQEVLLESADRFAEMKDETARAALAVDLFGKGGLSMIPLLRQGSAAIREQMVEAKQLGVVWSKDDAQAAETFNDSLRKLSFVVEGFKKEIGAELIPMMTRVAERTLDWVKANREWIKADLVSWVERTVDVGSRLLPVLDSIKDAAGSFIDTVVHGFDIASIGLGALAAKFDVVKNLFKEGHQFSVIAWGEVSRQFDRINMETVAQIQNLEAARLAAASMKKQHEEIVPLLEVQTVSVQEQKAVYDDIGKSLANLNIESQLKLAEAGLQRVTAAEKMGLAEIDDVRDQAFIVNQLRYQKDVAALQDSLQQKKITQADFEMQMQALTEMGVARQMQTIQQLPGFWETQLNAITSSNAFSMATIVNQGTGAFAQWAVQGASFKQFFIGMQTTLVQAVAQFGVQKLALLGAQASAESALHATTESTKVATTVTADAAIVASNATASTASVALWGGATAAILGFFSTIGAGFAAVTGALVTAVVAVGTFIMGVLSAIAEALTATVFGIPFAGAIVVGIGLIAAALAMTDNLPEFKAGGIMTGPTIGKFAEAGSPEAAIPLNDRGAAFMQKTMGLAGGGGMMQIVFESDGRQEAEYVMRYMPKVHRLKKRGR